jgi:hypothetical protein
MATTRPPRWRGERSVELGMEDPTFIGRDSF